MSTNIIPLAI